jgi:hypothetical protein
MRISLLLTSATVGLLAAATPAGAGELDDLRAQIQALQDRLSAMESREQRKPAPAAAVEAGSKPKSWKLPGTQTSMNIGGFAILQFDYDLDGIAAYAPGNAQVDGSAGARRQGNFNLDARQSRFFITTSTPTDVGELQTNLEIDFNGTGGGAGKTQYSSGQGAALRLRKAYGQLGPLLAGQDTTTFNVAGGGERTDVAQGFLGSSIFRLGMLRYTQGLGGGTSIDIAIEDQIGIEETATVSPGVAISTGNGAPAGPASLTGAALDRTPAFVGRLTHRWSDGEAGASFMVREVSVDNGAALDASTTAYGMNAGAAVSLSKTVRIGAQFIWGEGLGIYTGGGYGSSNDRFITAEGNTPNTFGIDTVSTLGGSAFFQWRFTDTMRLNLLYGREQYGYDLPKSALPATGATIAASTPDYMQLIYGNVMWEPVPQVNIGLQYLYGFGSLVNGPNAKQSRFELAFRYSF